MRYSSPVSETRTTLRFRLLAIPRLKGILEGVLDGFLRLLLGSQVKIETPVSTYTEEDLLARAPEFHRAAERYFIEAPDRDFLLGKPFTEVLGFPQRLFDLGVLLTGLRVRPGDLILDLGAGTCWASHFLHRHGCRTIAVDVSVAALALGRQVFQQSSATDPALPHLFLAYGGARLPLAAGSIDGILINDAFHHVPDQRRLLTEMARVLRSGGIAALREPGAGHASTAAGRMETESTGVLENDIVLTDLAELAEECGFSRVTVIPLALPAGGEIPARKLTAFLRGRGVSRHWRRFAAHLQAAHYILLYKGEFRPDSRRPGILWAEIAVARQTDTPDIFRAVVRNVGDTRWLARAPGGLGQVRLGAHVYDRNGNLLDFDGYRLDLPRDVEPGEEIVLSGPLPASDDPRVCRVELDLVAEGLTWFAFAGSPTAWLTLRDSSSSD